MSSTTSSSCAHSASSLTGVVIGDSLGDGGISRLQGAQGGMVRSSSEHLEAEVSKFEFEVFETETPSRGVSTVFICLYTLYYYVHSSRNE